MGVWHVDQLSKFFPLERCQSSWGDLDTWEMKWVGGSLHWCSADSLPLQVVAGSHTSGD